MKKTILGAIAIFIAGGIFACGIMYFVNGLSDKEQTLSANSTETTIINEETETTTYAAASQSNLINLSIEQDSQWNDGSAYCYGYSIPIQNTLNREISDWKMIIQFSDNVEIIQIWNGNYTTEGKNLTVTPVDYNKTIASGATVDLGFNCKTPSEAEIMAVDLYEGDTKIGTYSQGINIGDTASRLTSVMTSMPNQNDGKTPVEKYGKLSVSGTSIIGSDGNPVILQGVSTHGIAWFPQYVNLEAFRTLRDTMNVDVVRLALYSSSGEGYTKSLHSKIDEGVKYAKELGMYVIIDWHILSNGNPNTDKNNAVEFFTEMSQKYKDYDNVIYEICNEPNGDVQWERDIKPYAQDLISVIRKYDTDAIIIVGTPTWSQDVDIVAQSPIENQSNIMYALHFYAATHGDYIRNKLIMAINAGLPVFVSEFGICDASGNGGINQSEAEKWINLLRENNVSYVCWNLSNKNETSALIKSDCSKTSDWSDDELSESGKWIKNVYNK